MPFIKFSDIPPRDVFPGASGRYIHSSQMTAGEVTLAPCTVVPMHSHPHDQLTVVLAGRLDFTLGDETREMAPGDTVVIPGGVQHGVLRTHEACKLIDVFAPARTDYK